jgi:hypothetical protein
MVSSVKNAIRICYEEALRVWERVLIEARKLDVR